MPSLSSYQSIVPRRRSFRPKVTPENQSPVTSPENKAQASRSKLRQMLKSKRGNLTETKANFLDRPANAHILGTSENDEAAHPHVLSPAIMNALRPHMPFAAQCDNFWLKYSMVRDGASLETPMLHKVRGSTRTIIAIETTDGNVFGSFTSSPWHTSSRFYGSGEALLWRMNSSRFTPCNIVEDPVKLESNLDIFGWNGSNRNVQFVPNDKSALILGGGGIVDQETGIEHETDCGFGLVLESDLGKGFSDRCETFGNPPLSADDFSFDIANVEVWTMTPAESVEMAEQLEVRRQFILTSLM
eukprot:CAMPEP_0197465068 /NCGR_PEP_ID=MMETSP1175-20131217/64351_1 /TAXON_ID=1003142 /ORGANISM="Triceratium dubium, Strain CCMP147" /LENGTH=300 /DNA_ID=CAMNT_0043001073 /DNA_START=188 /DNA_END=1090 /DNA_ORIENTATION=+